MSFTSQSVTSGRTIAVLDRVATAEDVSVTDLPPLYDAIDPDSLETLLESGDVTVTFTYCGYRVTVTSAGTVDLVPDAEARAEA